MAPRTPAEMLALMEAADATERPLYVSYNNAGMALARNEALLRMLWREDLFDRLEPFTALEPNGVRHLFRYIPGARERFGSEDG